MTGLLGQAPERCRSARPRVEARGRSVCRRNQAQRATGATDAPCGALPGGRPGWAAPAPKPALAQRPPESGPDLTIRALGVPSRRTRAVNHGSCRSSLTSPFGVGAGPSLASTVPSKLVTLGPHRGHIPPEDHGQQRTLAVDRPPSSALPFGHNRRSSDQLDSLSHGGSQGFKSPHLHPQHCRSERRQHRADGAHCMLRPRCGRKRDSQFSREGSQRGQATLPPGLTMTTQRGHRQLSTDGRFSRASSLSRSATRSTWPLPNHLPRRRPSPNRHLRWPSTACTSFERQAPTRADQEPVMDAAGDHADRGHPSRAAACPTARSTTSLSADTAGAETHRHRTPTPDAGRQTPDARRRTPDSGHLDAPTAAPDTGHRSPGQARVDTGRSHRTLDAGHWPRTRTG